jgi:hypothetical protein
MEMQGLKPSVLMGKLKQHLPLGVSPDNDLFLSLFLIRLPPSMTETVGAGTHGMTAAMVNAADAVISEFNVQLLYLPGLKNVFADF